MLSPLLAGRWTTLPTCVVVGRKLNFLGLTDKKIFKEYLLHDGFSEGFIDNYIIPLHFVNKFDPNDTKNFSDAASKILKRPLKSLVEWAREHPHLFVD